MNRLIKNKGFKSLPLFIISTFVLAAEIGFPSYVLYIILAIWGIMNVRMNIRYDNIIIAFLFLIIVSYARFWQYNERMFLNITLTLFGICSFMNNKEINVNIKWLNIVAIFCFFMAHGNELKTMSMFSISTIFIDSSLETESAMLSFIFPCFALYYLICRDWKMCLINVVFTLLAGKRIAFAALFFSSIIYLLFLSKIILFNKLRTYIPWVAVGCNLLYFICSYNLAKGNFDDIIFEYIGLSSNAFTMGRENLYANAFSHYQVDNIFHFLFGIGSVSNFMERQLHNDIMKIMIENGCILFTMFWFFFYKSCNAKTFPYLLYLNILFMTDNTLIYVPVLFFMCFFIRKVNQKEDYLTIVRI